MDDAPTHEDARRGQTDPSLMTVDLDAVLARRASPRKRLLQLAVIVVPLLVVGAIVLRSALSPLVAPAVPTVDVPNAPVTITSNVTFGTLTVNGKRLRGPLPQTVSLRIGLNTLTLDAPPFAPRTCVVRGPIFAYSGFDPVVATPGQDAPPCVFSASDVIAIQAHSGTSNSPSGTPNSSPLAILAFDFTGADLAPDLQAQARQAVDDALASLAPQTATVPVGQSYATGLDVRGLPTSQRATAPLTASLSYSLMPPDPSSFHSEFGFPCASGLCALGSYYSQQVNAHAWIVAVLIAQRWRFTTAAGATVGAVTFTAAGQATVVLTYDHRAGWQIAASSSSAPSGTTRLTVTPDIWDIAWHQLGQALPALSPVDVTFSGQSMFDNPLPACSFYAAEQDGTPLGRFIWRFGVLSAADAKAHAVAPLLPVARPDEINAVGG